MNKKKPIDILQGKFRHFTGDVELDDENEDLKDRVYSGETIVGDKKKMHWTEDGWKEGEKKQNTNPFRIKKVGDKYEYDFVSYDEWDQMMTDGKDVKWDYEGDIDGFELWLQNWNIDDEWETYMNERNKMIKLKPLIKEDIEDEVKKNIDELGELQVEIDKLQGKLDPLKKQYSILVGSVLPILNQLGKEQQIAKNFIFRIIAKGYERKSVKYKEGFKQAMDRVNENTRKVLQTILDETKQMVRVSPRFKVSPIEMNEGRFRDWLKKLTRKLLFKLKKPLSLVKKGNQELRRIAR